MLSQILPYVVSTFLGLLASLGAWSIVFHFWRPVIAFSSRVSRMGAADEPGGFAYRIKFWNSGRRTIVDVTCWARLRIQGLNASRPANYEVTDLPVSFDGHIPVMFPRKKQGATHLVRIRTNKPAEFSRSVYPQEIRDHATNGTLTLEHLLSLGTSATVQLIGFGSDSFSGSRRMMASPEYKIADIVDRPFARD